MDTVTGINRNVQFRVLQRLITIDNFTALVRPVNPNMSFISEIGEIARRPNRLQNRHFARIDLAARGANFSADIKDAVISLYGNRQASKEITFDVTVLDV